MSSATRPPTCAPTWRGHIETTKDALLVFQACFDGKLQHCSRRPHDRERNQLIVSGNVFVYEEQTSGIKRWTDGIPWSPSRILTNFLIYRQLNSPFPPGEKKRATKRTQRPSLPGQYSSPSSVSNTPVADEPRSFPPTQPPDSPLARKDEDSPDKDDVSNRGLVGSLVDSYEFKEGGLLKKTMTVNVRNVQHHLVSYYSLEDAKHNLKTPRQDTRFEGVNICEQLLKQPKFKFPNIDDPGDGLFEGQEQAQAGYHAYAYAGQPYHYGYGYHQGAAMGYPPPGAYHPQHAQHHAGYSMPPSSAMYGPTAGAQAAQYPPQYQYPPHYPQQGHPQYHPAYQQQYPARQPQPTPATHPQYSHSTPAPQSHPVVDGYGGHANGGAAAVQNGEQPVPATSQSTHAQQGWSQQHYSQPQWAAPPGRPDYQTPAYRAPG